MKKLSEENLAYKAKREESRRQPIKGWRELVATLRHDRIERILKKLQEENLAYTAKSDESMRRATSMMMGGQANMVLKSVVTG